ncbi:Bug family tripartite tricarboxylate transporter substrate binding protein [Sabulicella rubraurantiaca]|uniref:Bug family tripartite tricarboxylate transporter substrate binding protein n=1 Tax=Sabulicella rubraurantiaca TaxID=2811429 RepID=UPI001A95A32C|nr:tripartite tricarboxylate transporter substrate-binding protein [Sabulicella rubraurantiaca]
MKDLGRRFAVSFAAITVAGLACNETASAQSASPSPEPVRLLVGFAQGSNSDVVARLLAAAMAPRLGRPVVVENRVGGSGNAMAEAVARAAPDGSTIGLLAPSFPVARHVARNLPFDPQADFTPISLTATAPVLVLVSPDLPARDLRELGEVLRSRPVVCATLGEGTFLHLSLVLLTRALGSECRPDHNPNPSAVIAGLEAGRVQLYFSAAAAALPAVRAGRARAIAVASTQRIAAAPDIPTVAETVPGFEVEAWYGVAGPSGLPSEVLDRLQRVAMEATRDPAVAGRLREVGAEPVGSTGSEFAVRLRAEDTKWAEAAQAAGLRPAGL